MYKKVPKRREPKKASRAPPGKPHARRRTPGAGRRTPGAGCKNSRIFEEEGWGEGRKDLEGDAGRRVSGARRTPDAGRIPAFLERRGGEGEEREGEGWRDHRLLAIQ